jgi:two-component system, cell cycle response regulator DivK
MTPMHALIVDDNQDNASILAEMLTMEGIESTRVQDPSKLEALLPRLPETRIVFLDLEMPKLNGYEVFNKLRAVQQFRQVPIVAYSVHVSEVSTVRELGFHSFLAKPLDLDSFPQQLSRIIKGERVWS